MEGQKLHITCWRNLMRVTFFLILLCLIAVTTSCDNLSDKPAEPCPVINDHGFLIRRLQLGELYKNQPTLYNTMNMTPQDSAGVYLYPFGGVNYYHPVAICHRSLEALSDFNNTQDQAYLQHAIRSMEALRRNSIRIDRMIYFPYSFDYQENEQTIYKAPWYSGMAQGMALSAYSRLYFYTREPFYQAVADSILKTLTDFDGRCSTVHITDEHSLVNDAGYYSIDEYPGPQYRYVLNGSIIGAMGLYDHWWVFGDSQSKLWLSRALTLYRDKVLLYRNPGEMSAYCLRFRVKNAHYHDLHQYLLRLCASITGDDFFGAIADLFHLDHPGS